MTMGEEVSARVNACPSDAGLAGRLVAGGRKADAGILRPFDSLRSLRAQMG